MKDQEHRLQCACVRWFALQYPQLRGLLFAVPNGSKRDAVTGARLKAEGVVPGVADLILLVPAVHHLPNEMRVYHGLCIEMKTQNGRQQPSQGAWQLKVEAQGYKYKICRSLDEFIITIKTYLS